MTDTDDKDHHWIWYVGVAIAIFVWGSYQREERERQKKAEDAICNIDCRYAREQHRIDEEARTKLSPQDYAGYKNDLKNEQEKILKEQQEENARRRFLTREERELLEEADRNKAADEADSVDPGAPPLQGP